MNSNMILNNYGCWLEDESPIVSEAIFFYQKQSTQERGATFFPLWDIIFMAISEEENSVLDVILDEEEIK